jgi:LPXTG-motif cell wall-anchored protein
MQRRFFVSFALSLALLAGLATVVFAQGGTKQVALVIGLPNNQVHAEVVTVPDTATTFDALQKASIKLVSQNTDFGPAICSINDTGCPSTNCFCDKQHFWAYYHFDAKAGKWASAQEGVGAYKPADGAVEGFVWSGADANFSPTDQPPVMTFAQVAGQAAGAQASTTVTTTQTSAPAALPTTGQSSSAGWLVLAGGLLLLAGFFVWRSRTVKA